jgi:hypothetical protein
MNTAFKISSWALLWSICAASAQESPPAAPAAPVPGVAAPGVPAPGAPGGSPAKAAPKSTAQMDAGEPRANTSATSSSSASRPAAPGTGATPAAVPTGAPAPGSTALSPSRSPARTGGTPRPPGAAGLKAAASADRLDLGTATVTGDREQPKVMYIVPWKKSDIGDLSGKPMNSLLDEALAPIDRDEFKREVAYFGAINSGAPQNGASNPAAKQGEK